MARAGISRSISGTNEKRCENGALGYWETGICSDFHCPITPSPHRPIGFAMLTIANSLLELIKAHAVDTYPNECSGLIIGDYEKREARKLYPMKNVTHESTRNRYLIDPKQ